MRLQLSVISKTTQLSFHLKKGNEIRNHITHNKASGCRDGSIDAYFIINIRKLSVTQKNPML